MAINSTKINKMSNHLYPQAIETKRPPYMALEIQVLVELNQLMNHFEDNIYFLTIYPKTTHVCFKTKNLLPQVFHISA
jgi:hypothetical protein